MKLFCSLLFALCPLLSALAQAPDNAALPFGLGYTVIGVAPVASVAVGTASSGYTTPPTVTFTGTGHGGAGTSTLKALASPTVTAPGSGYTVGDTLTLTGGTGTHAVFTVATITGMSSTGPVATVTVSGGSYTVIPTAPVSVTGGTGTGATFTPSYGVNTVVVTSGGGWASTTPTVVFSSGSAAGTATLAAIPAAPSGQYFGILPLTDTVLSSITFPTVVGSVYPAGQSSAYTGDANIIGLTLKASVFYPIRVTTVTPISGTALLFTR